MHMSPEHASTFKSIRGAFFAGAIALAPILVTAFVLNWLVGQIGGNFREFFLFFLPRNWFAVEGHPYETVILFGWNVVATIVALAQITLLGFFTRYVAGRFVFLQTERVMQRVPLIGAIYHSVKQIVETFSSQKRAVFQKVVMIQFPRPGTYAIGFLTGCGRGEAQARTEAELWNIFVPTTPNPTSGFLIMVPKEEVIEMDMTVGEAMKMIISGGAVTPPWPDAPTPEADTKLPTVTAVGTGER
jgi:uncharacterized membrane protein